MCFNIIRVAVFIVYIKCCEIIMLWIMSMLEKKKIKKSVFLHRALQLEMDENRQS